jgi:hypothetical protein
MCIIQALKQEIVVGLSPNQKELKENMWCILLQRNSREAISGCPLDIVNSHVYKPNYETKAAMQSP